MNAIFDAERTKMTTALSKLAQQENENDLVLNELKILGDDSTVYKLVGPALIKQDLDEARSNVEKRLQFIGDEMYDRRFYIMRMCRVVN